MIDFEKLKVGDVIVCPNQNNGPVTVQEIEGMDLLVDEEGDRGISYCPCDKCTVEGHPSPLNQKYRAIQGHLDAARKELGGHDIYKSKVMTAQVETRMALNLLTSMLSEMEAES